MNANDANERECNTEDQEHLNALLRETVGAVYEVANTLGAGFLEKVYERVLYQELKARGLQQKRRYPLMCSIKGNRLENTLRMSS